MKFSIYQVNSPGNHTTQPYAYGVPLAIDNALCLKYDLASHEFQSWRLRENMQFVRLNIWRLSAVDRNSCSS